jgi:hypothetical protein
VRENKLTAADRSGARLVRGFSAVIWRRLVRLVIQAAQVVADDRQAELHAHSLQTPQPELPQAALLFENSKNWFDDRFAPFIDALASGAA